MRKNKINMDNNSGNENDKVFLYNFNENSSKYHYNKEKNNIIKKNKNPNLYKLLLNNKKESKNILRLRRAKNNMKYIKQISNFKDLNLQPTSGKSWFFNNQKKKQVAISRNLMCNRNTLEFKKIIHIIHSNTKISESNFEFKSLSYINSITLDEKGNKNNYNYNSMSSHNILSKKDTKKDNKVILDYNFLNSENNQYFKESEINNKRFRLFKFSFKNNFDKNKYNFENKNKKYRLKSSLNKISRKKININKNENKNISQINENYKNNDINSISKISNKISSCNNNSKDDDQLIYLSPIFS